MRTIIPGAIVVILKWMQFAYGSDLLTEAQKLETASPFVIEASSVPAIVIEAPIEKSDLPAPSPIQVRTGVGAKPIDAPVNELGIEQRNMENLEDISLERRFNSWWLSPATPLTEWQTQYQADISIDYKMKTRLSKRYSFNTVIAEGGLSRNHRDILYIGNNGNPFESNSQLNTYPNKRDSEYFKLNWDGHLNNFSWKTLNEIDYKVEDVYAGPNRIGDKKQIQSGVSGNLNFQKFTLSPFFQIRKDRFNSQISPFLTNETHGMRVGTQSEYNITSNVLFSSSIERESFVRERIDQVNVEFWRLREKSLLKYSEIPWEWIEINTHFFIESAQYSYSRHGTDFLWDAGFDATTSRHRLLGWSLTGRRFSLLPTPSQLFGDGALLQGSPDLPLETGIRFATGPWWQSQSHDLLFKLSLFSEDSLNSPIMVAVSPSSVRTLPLGGIWTRGIQIEGSVTLAKIYFKSSLTYQDAVNASKINWQSGQPVPGRPKFISSSEIEFHQRRFKTGLKHLFKSKDPLDLGGLWFNPTQHRIDFWIGYGRKNWETRFLANNLIPNFNLPENLTFQGSAAPNLLEPTIQQREVRLQCELVL